jgi:hypothetical protein
MVCLGVLEAEALELEPEEQGIHLQQVHLKDRTVEEAQILGFLEAVAVAAQPE